MSEKTTWNYLSTCANPYGFNIVEHDSADESDKLTDDQRGEQVKPPDAALDASPGIQGRQQERVQIHWLTRLLGLFCSPIIVDSSILFSACLCAWLLALYQLHGFFDDGDAETVLYLAREFFPKIVAATIGMFLVRKLLRKTYGNSYAKDAVFRPRGVFRLLAILVFEALPFLFLYWCFTGDIHFSKAEAPMFISRSGLFLCVYVLPIVASMLAGFASWMRLNRSSKFDVYHSTFVLFFATAVALAIGFATRQFRVTSWPPNVLVALCFFAVLLFLFPMEIGKLLLDRFKKVISE